MTLSMRPWTLRERAQLRYAKKKLLETCILFEGHRSITKFIHIHYSVLFDCESSSFCSTSTSTSTLTLTPPLTFSLPLPYPRCVRF